MTQKEEVQRKARRDLLLILLVLPFGILFMFLTGGVATRLAPEWMMKASMRSNLDPRVSFALKSDNPNLLEPLSAEILTPAAWANVFLTPNAYTPPEAPPPNQSVPQQNPPVAAVPPGTEAPPGGVPSTAPPPTEPPPLPPGGGGPPPGNGDPPPGGGGPPSGSVKIDVDLQVTINDGLTSTYAAGLNVYTVTVSNISANDVIGATVTSARPSESTSWSWTCTTPDIGASCTPSGSSNINDKAVNLPAGTSITYSIDVIVGATNSGGLIKTASVSVPSGYNDTDNTNDSASDTNIPYIDLIIDKDDGGVTYSAGGTVNYTVTVTNNSTFDLTGIGVSDPIPDLVAQWTWSGTTTASDFNDSITLAAGSNLVYSVSATIIGSAGDNLVGTLSNTAKVTVPAGYTEAEPGDNESEEKTTASSNLVNIGPRDSAYDNPGDGETITIFLNTPIQSSNNDTPDMVYYERIYTGTTVQFDSVIVELSQDGTIWTQVFNWGDGNPEINSNVDISAPPQGIGGNEDDNRSFDTSELYNLTGATIDIDTSVSSGNYPWVRITCPSSPPNDGNDGCEIDAIQPYYP